MTKAPQDAVRKVSEILESAVSASSFLAHNNTTLTPPAVRAWAKQFRSERAWVRAEVPETVAEALIGAIEPRLEPYINRDTGSVGFAPYDFMLGRDEQPPTLKRLVQSMVSATAVIGSGRRIASAVLNWAHGEPGSYIETSVLSGTHLPEPFQFARGIKFENLSIYLDDLVDLVHGFAREITESHLAGRPVMRITHTVHAMFYRPEADEDMLSRLRANRARIAAPEGAEHFHPDQLTEALSLVCGASVQFAYRWPEYHDEVVLLRGDLGAGRMFNPSARNHGLQNEPLTRETLNKAITVIDKRSSRRDLDVAVARWQNSMSSATDFVNSIIDLRTALECIYAPGVRQELRFRTALLGALHMAPSEDQRIPYYNKLKDLYDSASKLVHGGTVDRDRSHLRELAEWAQEFCRQAILKRLDEPRPTDQWSVELALGVRPEDTPSP